MRLLFCHDGPMNIDLKGNAYPQTFTKDVLDRYYVIADELTFITRTRIIDPKMVNRDRANMDKFTVVSAPNISSVKGIIFERKKLISILEKEIDKNDFLIVRLPSQIGNIAIDLAKKKNKPYLVEVVACPWDSLWNHSLKGKICAPIRYFAMKNRVYDAKYVVYVTNEFLQKRYPTSGESIACSNVLLKEFDDAILDKRLKRIEKNENDKIILGTTGAVNVKFKGQQYIIKALGILKKQGITNFEYQLVGGGDQTYLQSIAKKYDVTEQIKFIGSIPHSEVFEWLEKIDIYIQPSRQEGLPRGLIEAMSKAVPAFGAKTAGIPELLCEDFIFSNSKHNIDEICEILLKFDKNIMCKQARRNYNESKKYSKNIIDERRKEFFNRFKDKSLIDSKIK